MYPLKHDLFSPWSNEKLIPGQHQAKNHDTPFHTSCLLFLDLLLNEMLFPCLVTWLASSLIQISVCYRYCCCLFCFAFEQISFLSPKYRHHSNLWSQDNCYLFPFLPPRIENTTVFHFLCAYVNFKSIFVILNSFLSSKQVFHLFFTISG